MMRWRALFAVLTAAVSIYHVACLVVSRFFIESPVDYTDFAICGFGVAGVGLVFPLVRGRNWARLALIGAVGGFALVLAVAVLRSAWQIEWDYSQIIGACSAVLYLVVAALIVLALMHRDVRRDFDHQ